MAMDGAKPKNIIFHATSILGNSSYLSLFSKGEKILSSRTGERD
jgi:hypothetical protein